MNEEIIFKWDGENDRESVKKCIWKKNVGKMLSQHMDVIKKGKII